MTAITFDQTVQEWGNGLAVRITAKVDKAVRFSRGLLLHVGLLLSK
jgi:antitoxin component of MazEF toxin-antitoxin module